MWKLKKKKQHKEYNKEQHKEYNKETGSQM